MATFIEAPDDAGRDAVVVDDLPYDWNLFPDHPACAEIGDRWAMERQTLLLRVPSAIVHEEWDVLINLNLFNLAHARARDLHVVSRRRFAFDPRLL